MKDVTEDFIKNEGIFEQKKEQRHETVSALKRIVRRISPICYGHHLSLAFGYALLPIPIFKYSIGYFQFGKSHDENGFWNPKWSIRVFKISQFHNCTWTGKY